MTRRNSVGRCFFENAKPETVLVVAAHPDDEVLGCGGTMAWHAVKGDKVYVLILGEGARARVDGRHADTSRKTVAALRGNLKVAAKILGVTEVNSRSFPDNRFDTVDLLDLVKAVETEKLRVRPTIVYTHHSIDLNVDHRLTAQAVQTAFRPQPGDLKPTILAFEVPSSTEYQSPLVPGPFQASVYVNISSTLAAKCRAMTAYKTEVRPYPHPRSIRSLEIIARRNGIEVGIEAAERFSLVRTVIGADTVG